MSDDDIYFDNEEDQEIAENQEMNEEEDILDTPEKMYDSAQTQLGMDDYYSIDLFYKIYVDDGASEEMKRDSLKEIAKAISQHPDDIERIINVLSDVFYAYQDGLFNISDLNQVVSSMINNLSSFTDALSQFLDAAESQIDKNDNPLLYADVKLRKLYLLLPKNQFKQIEETIEQIEPLVPYSPDIKDHFIRSVYFRLIILKINIADEYHDEDKMIQLFNEAKEMQIFSLTTYQNGIFSKMQGILLKKNRKFYEAKNSFYEAFKYFDDIGNDKRIDCIKYCAICEMANHDLTSIFNSSRVSPYKNDENIILIYKMDESYIKNDIAQFVELIKPVSELYYNNKFDIGLLDEIRKYVLRGAIWHFSRNFHKYEIKFAAEKFSSDIDEVRQLIMDLILSKDLDALLNPENGVVTVIEQFKQSIYLSGIHQILSTVESSLMRISDENKLDY